MRRHTVSSHGDTPILIQTCFSHPNAFSSTYAYSLNEYANLAFSVFSRSKIQQSGSHAATRETAEDRSKSLEKQTRRQKDNTRASDSNHVTQASPDHHDQEKRAESRDTREESSSHGDTPLLSRRGSHISMFARGKQQRQKREVRRERRDHQNGCQRSTN